MPLSKDRNRERMKAIRATRVQPNNVVVKPKPIIYPQYDYDNEARQKAAIPRPLPNCPDGVYR